MKKETLDRLHKTQVDILIAVDRVCNKHNIEYFIIGGTLLGAVRHKGFIPWDDDLDIVMPRDDYEKFLHVRNELPDSMFLHCMEDDENYPMPMPKIKLKNTVFEEANAVNVSTYKGIYIDIFPMDNAEKESCLFQTIQAKIQGAIGASRAAKLGLYDSMGFSTLNKCFYMLLRLLSNKSLYKLQKFIQTLDKNPQSKYFVNFASGYGFRKQTIPKNVYFPARMLEFEGHLFKAPNDYEFYLRRIYGNDYMSLPPEEKRITHNPLRLSFDLNGPDEEL